MFFSCNLVFHCLKKRNASRHFDSLISTIDICGKFPVKCFLRFRTYTLCQLNCHLIMFRLRFKFSLLHGSSLWMSQTISIYHVPFMQVLVNITWPVHFQGGSLIRYSNGRLVSSTYMFPISKSTLQMQLCEIALHLWLCFFFSFYSIILLNINNSTAVLIFYSSYFFRVIIYKE